MKFNQKYFTKVAKYFDSEDEAWEWFLESKHPSLSMRTPIEAIKLGQTAKVISLIDEKFK